MLQTIVGKIRGLAMASTLATLFVGIGVANAAVYKTTWDPLFNTAYSPTLGWSGSGFASMDPSCLVGPASNVLTTSCGGATLTSFSLSLFDPYPGTSIGSTGGAVSMNIPTIKIDGSGNLLGVDLGGATFFAGTFGPIPSTTDTVDAYLGFEIGDPLNADYVGPKLTLDTCGDGCDEISEVTGTNAPVSTPWTLVPEPASLALVGAALAALGLSRRRNR